MPTHLSFDAHLAGLRDATMMMARYAAVAGLDVDVPTCPEWTVRGLIGHTGAVHRWAEGLLVGEKVDVVAAAKAGRRNAHPVDWLSGGVVSLVTTLVRTDENAEVPVILHDPPPPRLFWTRRMHHETTMHAVDALAASLGRLPGVEETWISETVALDGIDELLMGFVPRSRSPLRVDAGAEPVTIAVRTPDAPYSWSVRVSEEAPMVARHDDGADPAEGDVMIEAPAVALYLALWHRTDEVESDGLTAWDLMRV